ncbi:hypothetical protein AU468_14295 [Alkalispirochaeta sphaeroplastigenens]|uniref:Uncharacterized protein n=1 Tax=Alkalispirochaeta sphaeroplastigenens TaxID=1187066 RepID=A0A2S4JFB0_9SPIO|nr:hypothetical protein [Alkalispirochaeta sphaeroplastigenens]POQ98202.1 hypothetical protein AU468_14295 [Alkalispirochaeta sphaeroplastigenens]
MRGITKRTSLGGRCRPFLLVLFLPIFLAVGGQAFSQESLQRGFRELLLGLPFETIQDRLKEDLSFSYRGEPDVSMSLTSGEYVIDVRGRRYLERGLFQFHQEELYIITLYPNPQLLDYFQIFERLRSRYGEPRDLDNRRAFWEDGITRIELERPLVVRYLDLQRFLERRQERRTRETLEDLSREQFLESF